MVRTTAFLDIIKKRQTIPWTADLEYWIAGREQDGTADPAWRSETGYLDLCKTLGVFPYYKYDHFWCGKPVYDQSVQVLVDQGPKHIRTTWKTPVGTLAESVNFMDGSCSWAHTKHAVQSGDDLTVFEYLIEHRRMIPQFVDTYPEQLKRWKQFGGMPALAMPRGPLSALFYEWAGVVNGVYLLMDYPDRMKHIFQMMTEQEKPLLQALAKLQPPLVHFADNVSGDNMSGYFDQYMRNVYEERLQILHPAGIPCAVHLDGVINDIAGKIADVGIDVIEALTPAPGGTVEVEDIRTIVGDDSVVLWGGIPGTMFTSPYTWDDVRRQIDRTLAAWKGTPFVIGVADQVPADGDIGIVKNISEYLQEKSDF
jgi:hypothetical protein